MTCSFRISCILVKFAWGVSLELAQCCVFWPALGNVFLYWLVLPRLNSHCVSFSSTGKALDRADLQAQFGSHYKKGAGSWIKNEDNIHATTPSRSAHQSGNRSHVKQLIPTSDQKQPLARRHSSMINQCTFPFSPLTFEILWFRL